MKDQIQLFLKKENITATKLANDIGVQRSSISHILSGRNKPSYDLIYKMIEKYPYLNADWLITGKGNMYKDNKHEKSEHNNLLLNSNDIYNKQRDSIINAESNRKEDQIIKKNIEKQDIIEVEKIVIFYSNSIFKVYSPE